MLLFGLVLGAASAFAAGPTRPVRVSVTPFPQKDIVVDGMRLRYIDVGRGPALMILPGLTSRIEEFDKMTGTLSKRFRVLVADMPGSGYSDKPERDYSVDFYDQTTLHFLDALGVKTCYLAGGSLGGNMVLRLARQAPERFPKVVAWAPGASWTAKPFLAWLGHVFGGKLTFWPVVKVQSTFWYGKQFPGRQAALDATFAYYKEIMCPGFVRMYWDLANESIGTSLQPIAREIRRPVLLVWGDKDDGGGMAAGVARLHELIPDNKLLVFPGARHSLAVERPAELASAIESFLLPD